MFVSELKTDSGAVRLIKPSVERDAPLGVQWLEGDVGRETLRLMGVNKGNNQPSNIYKERERVSDFLERSDQLNWMIESNGVVVGSIWVDLKATEYLEAPSSYYDWRPVGSRQGRRRPGFSRGC